MSATLPCPGLSRHNRGTTGRVECRKGALGLGPDLSHAALQVCTTGAWLVLREALPPGQEVEVLLRPAPGTELRRVGRVVWSAPVGGLDKCASVAFDEPLTPAELGRVCGSAA